MKLNNKESFIEEVKKFHQSKLPLIIATDVLGHFNTTVIVDGKIFVLDSLPYVEGQYDDSIVEAICYLYKQSFLKEWLI